MSALPNPKPERRVTFRPTLGGHVSIPVEMLSDNTLIKTDILMALCLTAGMPNAHWTTAANNDRLTELTGFQPRAIQESLKRLADGGWIAVVYETSNGKGRVIHLRWRMPDDFADLKLPALPGIGRPSGARRKGGEP